MKKTINNKKKKRKSNKPEKELSNLFIWIPISIIQPNSECLSQVLKDITLSDQVII